MIKKMSAFIKVTFAQKHVYCTC